MRTTEDTELHGVKTWSAASGRIWMNEDLVWTDRSPCGAGVESSLAREVGQG
jgi:hypothetical protein